MSEYKEYKTYVRSGFLICEGSIDKTETNKKKNSFQNIYLQTGGLLVRIQELSRKTASPHLID